ncbi:MAG: hypothetical protein AAF399_20095 [Bacteroidota bacterium]
MNKDQLQEEIDRTLQSLDQVERVGPRPFFHTRLQARLERESAEAQAPVWAIFLKPKVQWGMLAVVLLLNVGAFWYGGRSSLPDTQVNRIEGLQALGSVYGMEGSTLYQE